MDNAFYADKAEKLFREGCNCSQAVFAAFCDVTGFSTEAALKISSGFGGGFGRRREVCGAVCGMTMVLGCLLGNGDTGNTERKNEVYAMISKCMDDFSVQFGSFVCRDILGIGQQAYSPVSSVRTPEFYAKRPCIKCIRTAARITQEVLCASGCI